MAAPLGYRLPKGPLDKWSTRERLALASSVRRSGNQNWISVSRAIKPFGEDNRPAEWFSQKNCALQYADLLEKAETPKRKRGEKGEREVVETPAIQIARKLTIERIEELKQIIQNEQQQYKQLKREIEALNSGKYDDKLDEMWEKMQLEKAAEEAQRKEEEKKLAEEAAERAKAQALHKAAAGGLQRTSSTMSSEVDESTQDSMPEHLNVETTDDEFPTTPTTIQPISVEVMEAGGGDSVGRPARPPSPLLSSLLQSKQFSVDSLQQIKAEAEAEHAQRQTMAANQIEVQEQPSTNQQPPEQFVTTVATTEVYESGVSTIKVENETVPVPDVKTEIDVISTDIDVMDVSHIKEEIVDFDGMVVEETIEVSTHESPVKQPPPPPVISTKVEMPPLEEPTVSEAPPGGVYVSVVQEEVTSIEEPLSPASSISSRVSETGSKSSSRKLKSGRSSTGGRRSSVRSTRRSNATDDLSSRPSDAETTDDDGDSSVVNVPTMGTVMSESIPNSPHSSHCSDTEDDKAYKAWKKSIMLVWRAAANHKYANVFLHQVTDDIAPGYSTVVRRPKDLTIIKRHIENGTIRTTTEFQRDMMLMFTNAIMYNNANHDVYRMAIEMYNDVLEQIEQYVSTQLMVQQQESKLLRGAARRNENSDKEEDSRRRRTSSEAEGGKAKKRKSRADET